MKFCSIFKSLRADIFYTFTNRIISSYFFALKISIIIVNYNAKELLDSCLQFVIDAARNINSEIIVVDNASTDESSSFFKNKFNEVEFIWNNENIGFSKANNLALKKVTGDYILFLNPDTVIPEDCLEKCIQFFGLHSDCGALGVKMLNEKGTFLKESKRGFPTPLVSFYKMIGLCKLFPRSKKFAKYYEGHLNENETNKVEVLSGAFMMLSKSALSKVSGFDERFFMYGEDIDLSHRISQAGFNNYYFAETSIIHYKGKSTNKKDSSYTKYFYGSMKLFAEKYYGNKKIKLFFINRAIDFVSMLSHLKRMLTRN